MLEWMEETYLYSRMCCSPFFIITCSTLEKDRSPTLVKLKQPGFSSSNNKATTQWNEDLRTWDQRFDMLDQCLCTPLLLLHQHLRDLEILSWTSQQTDSRLDPGWLLIYPNNYRH